MNVKNIITMILLIMICFNSEIKANMFAYNVASEDTETVATEENEDEPSAGTGFIVAGWILSGVAVVNALTIPLIRSDGYRDSLESSGYTTEDANQFIDVLTYVCVAFVIVEAGIGIPMLIVGYNKRSIYNDWLKRQSIDNVSINYIATARDGEIYYGLNFTYYW